MKTSLEILNELKSISPLLAGIAKTNVFTVPEGYFNSIENSILANARTAHLTGSLQKVAPYTVPEGYFDSLADNVLDKIKNSLFSASEELRSISPLLYSFQNENVFTTPPGYFDELPEEVVMKIKPQEAVLIRMKRRSSVWLYARAAVMTGIIAVSALMVYNNQSPYLHNVSSQPGGQYSNEQQINEGISKLSDEEIIKYLETNGSSTDNETLTNNIDEKQLPEKHDFLNNDEQGSQENSDKIFPQN